MVPFFLLVSEYAETFAVVQELVILNLDSKPTYFTSSKSSALMLS